MATANTTSRHTNTPLSAGHFTPHCTLEEVAKELGCTRERVRQIEKRALAKCAAYLARHDLTLSNLVE